MQTPWAILLTKFSDNDAEPYNRSRYEEIFTTSGSGKWNMVDFFHEMSHGKLDLSGSKVFGWYTLDKTESEYTGSGANPQGRQDLINWARQKAIDNGVSLNEFFNVVVVLNNGLDLFGGGNGVVCGDDGRNMVLSGLSPSLLGRGNGTWLWP
jgi:M6 family metalloprotease-like protein